MEPVREDVSAETGAGDTDNTRERSADKCDDRTDSRDASRVKCCRRTHADTRKNVDENGADEKHNMPIEEARRIYKSEVRLLWAEVERFRVACHQQMRREQQLFEVHRKKIRKLMKDDGMIKNNSQDGNDRHQLANDNGNLDDVTPSVPDLPSDLTKQLNRLKVDMNFLDDRPESLDTETKLAEKEEYLVRRQQKLEQFEKDVEEVEAMLEKRHSLCEMRSKEMDLYNDDLLHMQRDIECSMTNMESLENGSHVHRPEVDDEKPCYNTPEASNKARRHWSIARRHLIDKVALLETTVKRYRTELASATASVTAKDMLISRLTREKCGLQDEVSMNEKRIKQLETELSLTLEEKRRHERNFEMLLEELQTIDIHANNKLLHSSDNAQQKPENVKKKLLRKQQSSFSFFTSDTNEKDSHAQKNVFKRRNNATDRKRSQSSSPFKKQSSLQEDVNGECVQETMALQQSGGRASFDDIEEGSTDNREKAGDNVTDSGSKACILM